MWAGIVCAELECGVVVSEGVVCAGVEVQELCVQEF